jgi:hypothetical protein
MRHLAVARGCVAVATSASARLNASILDAEQSINCVVSKSHQVHCRRTTDFDYRSLCNKAWIEKLERDRDSLNSRNVKRILKCGVAEKRLRSLLKSRVGMLLECWGGEFYGSLRNEE